MNLSKGAPRGALDSPRSLFYPSNAKDGYNARNKAPNILQWNAGGMSPDKMIQVQKILQTYDVDIFTITEANISDDKLKYYQFPGYTLYNLPKYRQVTSGILTGVKEGLTSHYDLIKSMGSTQDMQNNQIKCLEILKPLQGETSTPTPPDGATRVQTEQERKLKTCFARFYFHKQKKNPFARKSSRDLKIQVKQFGEIKEDTTTPNNVLTEPFRPSELNAAIQQLKCKKSPDEDDAILKHGVSDPEVVIPIKKRTSGFIKNVFKIWHFDFQPSILANFLRRLL
ncbi:unnamed protein product [Rodentolepis nana]|uniref:Endo/exonuclease/phosphatase domain-containing protein n=1 Tax=Rodentolepis nana TaxID=102285 RepID=A0A0R3TT18_RODNA|nr:unnamed protein product [Rodentolepis nana]